MNTWDLSTVIFIVSWLAFVYYGIKAGRTIEELSKVGGTVTEALITEPASIIKNKLFGKRKVVKAYV